MPSNVEVEQWRAFLKHLLTNPFGMPILTAICGGGNAGHQAGHCGGYPEFPWVPLLRKSTHLPCDIATFNLRILLLFTAVGKHCGPSVRYLRGLGTPDPR